MLMSCWLATDQPRAQQFTIYIENHAIKENLTREEFKQVEEPEEADILWPSGAISRFANRKDTQFINQFPYEVSI